jgi:hypothetical protein
MGPRSELVALEKNKMFFLCWDSSHYSFVCPVHVLFFISTELSQLQSWNYFEKYVVCITIVFEILLFHYVFWDVCMTCRLWETCQLFGGTYCLDFQVAFLSSKVLQISTRLHGVTTHKTVSIIISLTDPKCLSYLWRVQSASGDVLTNRI